MSDINKIEVRVPSVEQREADLAQLTDFTPDEASYLRAAWVIAWSEGGDMYAIAQQNAVRERQLEFARWGVARGIFDELIAKSEEDQ